MIKRFVQGLEDEYGNAYGNPEPVCGSFVKWVERFALGLLREEAFIGQFGDPGNLRKIPALFYEFQQFGANKEIARTRSALTYRRRTDICTRRWTTNSGRQPAFAGV